jgi:hypothetical protein
MLSLLDYNGKKARMLQEYYTQLRPQLEADEPWTDEHRWAIFTSEVEVLVQETTQLYATLLRADELHHYAAVTWPTYPYDKGAKQLNEGFTVLVVLLQSEQRLIDTLEGHGYTSPSKPALEQCLRELEILLTEESPVYRTEAFQAVLQQSLDDLRAGRVMEMRPEQL